MPLREGHAQVHFCGEPAGGLHRSYDRGAQIGRVTDERQVQYQFVTRAAIETVARTKSSVFIQYLRSLTTAIWRALGYESAIVGANYTLDRGILILHKAVDLQLTQAEKSPRDPGRRVIPAFQTNLFFTPPRRWSIIS